MGNAKIHMYEQLEAAVYQTGARLLYLPPYAPQLNPIEVCFGRLKKWIHRHANLMFPIFPEKVLEVAMMECTKSPKDKIEDGVAGEFWHCGHKVDGLEETVFQKIINPTINKSLFQLI